MSGFSPRTAAVIIERDHGRCFVCGRKVDLSQRGIAYSLHHRRPRGSGGSKLAWVDLPSNGIIACGSGTTGCHGWIESHRAEARDLGYLVPLNGIQLPSEVPVARWDASNLVYLTDNGWFAYASERITTP